MVYKHVPSPVLITMGAWLTIPGRFMALHWVSHINFPFFRGDYGMTV